MAASRRDKRAEMEEVGGRLEYCLRQSQMSKAALSRHSGVRAEAIGRLARGERLPENATLRAIAEALGVPPGWLVFGDGPPPRIRLAPPEDRDQRLAVIPDRRRLGGRKRQA